LETLDTIDGSNKGYGWASLAEKLESAFEPVDLIEDIAITADDSQDNESSSACNDNSNAIEIDDKTRKQIINLTKNSLYNFVVPTILCGKIVLVLVLVPFEIFQVVLVLVLVPNAGFDIVLVSVLVPFNIFPVVLVLVLVPHKNRVLANPGPHNEWFIFIPTPVVPWVLEVTSRSWHKARRNYVGASEAGEPFFMWRAAPASPQG
jgi:hypothetical protein